MKIFPSKKRAVLCIIALIIAGYTNLSINEKRPLSGQDLLSSYLINKQKIWTWVLVTTQDQDVLNAALNDDGGIDKYCEGDIFNKPKGKEYKELINRASIVYWDIASQCHSKGTPSLYCEAGKLRLSCLRMVGFNCL